MPLVTSEFNARFPFTNKHFSTMYRTLFTQFNVKYTRKRIHTPDGDFLDLDFSKVNSNKIALLIHGLEGSSNSTYILSTVTYLNSKNIDVVVLNLRGCSGELNKLYRAYHTGETGDLDFVLQYISKEFSYEEINLVGFSLGGKCSFKICWRTKKQHTKFSKKDNFYFSSM